MDIYVLERDDGEKRLVGVVSLRDLLLVDEHDTVEDIMQRDPISILPTEERWEAAVLVSKYNLFLCLWSRMTIACSASLP